MTLAPLADRPPPAMPRPGPVGVVLVHGLRNDGTFWSGQLAHLDAAGHQAVAVDLPAHGTRRGERFSFSRAFEVVDDAVRSLPPDLPIVVVGQSLGGYVTLGWAAEHAAAASGGAGRLAGVVASGCCTDPRGKPVTFYRGVADGVARSGAALRRLVPGRTAPDPVRPGWEVVTDALSELAGRSSVAALRSVRSPVWLVNGARDHLRWQEQRHLRATERGALVVVPRAGHDVSAEAPDVYNRMLDRALAEFAHV